MARFYLNLTRGNDPIPNDHEPQEFPNLEAAKAEAIASLQEISTLKGQRYDGIDIVGEDGQLLLTVPASSAVKSK
jgi:hypothetical protein